MKINIIICAFVILFSDLLQAQQFWAEKVGGSGDDRCNSMVIDASGNIYTTGLFSSTADFDPGTGILNLIATGAWDVFVSKIDASGSLVWAKKLGGTNNDVGNAIAVDVTGNVFITGYFEGTADFDPGTGTSNLTSDGNNDIFICKLNSSGNFVWAKQTGGAGWDEGFGISTDANGNVYTTGYFGDTVDFNPGTSVSNLISAGNYDIFVSKLDASGNFVWAKRLGGSQEDSGKSITVDGSGNVYSIGYFNGNADFDPGTGNSYLASFGLSDIFISKLDASGNFVWGEGLGGTGYDQGNSIALDASGNVYSTGYFSGTADLNPSFTTNNFISAGGNDIFISKLDASGAYVWAKQMGSTAEDRGNDIIVDINNNIYTTGYFNGTADFNPGTATSNLTSAGSTDIFISKLDATGNFVSGQKVGGSSFDYGNAIAVDASGNIITSGYFKLTGDFDPGSATFNLTSAGNNDVFICKSQINSSVSSTSYDEYSVSIYPNPSANNLWIKGKDIVSVSVYDCVGHIIKTININHAGEAVLPVYELENGLYFIRVLNGKTNQVLSFIKK